MGCFLRHMSSPSLLDLLQEADVLGHKTVIGLVVSVQTKMIQPNDCSFRTTSGPTTWLYGGGGYSQGLLIQKLSLNMTLSFMIVHIFTEFQTPKAAIR